MKDVLAVGASLLRIVSLKIVKDNINLTWERNNMDIFEKYPEVKKQFEKLLQTRRNEILDHILETDEEYKKLVRERMQASMSLKNIMLVDSEANILFEKYSDTIYAQEIYELEVIYKQAFIDAIIVCQNQELL